VIERSSFRFEPIKPSSEASDLFHSTSFTFPLVFHSAFGCIRPRLSAGSLNARLTRASEKHLSWSVQCVRPQVHLTYADANGAAERRSGGAATVARREFPRFSVSAVAVTLSYFRRPHRNPKVRLIPRTWKMIVTHTCESLAKREIIHRSSGWTDSFDLANAKRAWPHSTASSMTRGEFQRIFKNQRQPSTLGEHFGSFENLDSESESVR